MNKLLLVLGFIFLLTLFTTKNIENNQDTDQDTISVNEFFNRNINYTCASPTPENDICKVDQNRQCIVDNYENCYIKPEDEEEAHKYAYKKLCMEKGHCFAEYPDGSYSCEFTKETCANASGNPKNDNIDLYSSEELEQNKNKYPKTHWIEGVGCINKDLGISQFKNYCTTDHACNMGSWHYDEENIKCTIKPEYCEKMRMDYYTKGNNIGYCSLNTGDAIAEGLLGKTMSRAGSCPPYADIWGGGDSEKYNDIKKEHCFSHIK